MILGNGRDILGYDSGMVTIEKGHTYIYSENLVFLRKPGVKWCNLGLINILGNSEPRLY